MIFFSHDVWISTRETSVSLVLYLRANSARKDAQGKRRNEAEMNKIFWAADSTVQTNDFTTYPQTGIGQVFPLFVKNLPLFSKKVGFFMMEVEYFSLL